MIARRTAPGGAALALAVVACAPVVAGLACGTQAPPPPAAPAAPAVPAAPTPPSVLAVPAVPAVPTIPDWALNLPAFSTARPLCMLETRFGAPQPVRERSYPPGYWLTLLIEGYRSTGGEVPRPAHDCLGERVKLDWDGCPMELDPEVLPPRALTPKDVAVNGLDATRRLVWAMIDRLSDGEAQGPVAITEVSEKGIAVRALGVLRAYPQNVVLRLEKLGSGAVLAADGEYCAPGQIGEECARAVRLLPLVDNRFVGGPMVDAAGTCIGRPLIPVRGSGVGVGGEKYHVETLVTFSGEAVLVREQLGIESQQARRPDAARDSYIKRVQADRQLSLRGAHLIASEPSLLSRWMHPKDAVRGGTMPGGK